MAKLTSRDRRKLRIRGKISGSTERPRLTVYRSSRHIYAQVIDDTTGKVLAAASTQTADLRSSLKATSNVAAAKAVGKQIAVVALACGVTKVCFDRRGRQYHGRVKALAEAAREAGLSF